MTEVSYSVLRIGQVVCPCLYLRGLFVAASVESLFGTLPFVGAAPALLVSKFALPQSQAFGAICACHPPGFAHLRSVLFLNPLPLREFSGSVVGGGRASMKR